MGPAVERREHVQQREPHVVMPGTAMEPAVRRQKHRSSAISTWFSTLPQWSPPSDGGSNPTGIEWIPPEDVPQWSPPLNGGNTLDGVTLTFAPTTQPQWSPPLNGGSTVAVAHGEFLDLVPQWSPRVNSGSTTRRSVAR
jgi:hypothetical protein